MCNLCFLAMHVRVLIQHVLKRLAMGYLCAMNDLFMRVCLPPTGCKRRYMWAASTLSVNKTGSSAHAYVGTFPYHALSVLVDPNHDAELIYGVVEFWRILILSIHT